MSNDQPGWMPPQEPEPGQSPPAYGQPYGQQQPYGYGQPFSGSAYPPLPGSAGRPGGVTAAGVITLVLSGLCAALFLILSLVMFAAKGDFLDAMKDELADRDNALTINDLDQLYGVIVTVILAFLIWCLAACVLAVLVLRRHNVARILLVVSSSVTALVSLLAITSGVSVVTLAGSIAVIVLLFTGGANDWFARRPIAHPTHQPW